MILTLENFRRFENYKIEIDTGTTILTGPNGCGKSSIIESLYYCSFFKSNKTTQTNELITFDKLNSSISLDFDSTNIAVNFEKNKHQSLLNKTKKKDKELLNIFSCLLIDPDTIEIITKGPLNRRNFVNRSLSQINQVFIENQVLYNNLLKQKNKFLKQDEFDETYYKVITKDLLDVNSNLINIKNEYLNELNLVVSSVHKWISKTSDQISLQYLQNPMPSNLLQSEKRFMTVQFGNHLDDIEILINGRLAKKFASQGQKRTIAISLILGQMQLMFNKTGKYPMVMIDDIHADLDFNRQNMLYTLLKDKTKVIIATPNIENISQNILNSDSIKVIKLEKSE